MSITFCLFETALGTGGIAWGERGVVGIQLPEPDAGRVRRRLERRFLELSARQGPPPPSVQAAIAGMTDLLSGQPVDLSDVELDLERVPDFDRQVYAVARTIPAGQTLSYGQIAARLGEPRLAREVGQALAQNPFPIVVPCHRVVAAGGRLGGFSAYGGVSTKQRLLEIERANVAWQLPLVL
jgi:methylated-DNA-[protein]-cysteine S-methyltransferase